MGVLFDQYPGEGKLGSQITISDGDIMLFVSERDEVFLYMGICMNDEDNYYKSLKANPYTMHDLHSTNKAIHDKIDRGTTLLNATSGHLQQDQKVVMSIINNRQLHELTQVVKEVDPHAFLIVNRINEVHGNGFTIKLDDKQRIEALKNQ